MWEQTSDKSPLFPKSKKNWWSSKQRLETLKSCSVFLFAHSRYRSTHFRACPSMSLQLPLVSTSFTLHFSWCLCTLPHLDQLNKFLLSIFLHISRFGFSIVTFLFLPSLSGFPTSYPSVRPHVIWTWCRLDFCQSLTGPLGGFSFNKLNFVKPVHESDRFLFPSTFHSHQFVFLVLRPNR